MMQPQPHAMSTASQAYRKQGILTASPIELIIMLYDGLKKDLLQAQLAINNQKPETAHKKLINAQDIISELINSLDFRIDLSDELLAIYEFLLREIETINLKKDTELIPPVVDIVETLRGTWQEVAEMQKNGELK